MPDVKFRVDAGRSKQSVEQTNRLLQAVSEIQLKFIRESAAHSWFEQTLQAFLDVTESEYGFIGTVHHDGDDLPWLQTQAISNIAWDQASRELYESSLPEGLQFRNLKTLFGQTLRTGKLFISNSPNEDAFRGGLPSGHPALTAFMAIPLKIDDRLIGMVGFANRTNGYDSGLADWLEPLSTTAATLMIASRSQEARRAAENEAAHRQKQLQTILDTVNARILYLDTEGRIVRHNLHSHEMTGLSADDCIGKTVEEVGFRLDDGRLRHQQSLKVMRSGKPNLGRLISHTSEGKTYWSTVDKIPTFDANGKVDGLLVFVYDVTELHSTNEALQRTESQLSILLEKMPALLWSVDQNHVFTLAVGKTLERLGKQPGETVGSTLSEYFGTDDPLSPPIARHLSALDGKSVQYESTWNGCIFDCRLEPVRNDKGEVTGCLGVALDVSDRARSELERRQTEELWRAVVENVPDFILVVGREGQIRFLNHYMDGHDRRDVLQATVFDYQPVESHEKIRDALRRVFEDGDSVSYETIGRGKSDEWRNYVCRVVPMNVSETEPAALMVATDVTEERDARDAEARHFALLNAITEGTSELIFAKDIDSQPVFVNEATIRLHGKTGQEMIGRSEEALFSKSSFEKTVADDKRIMRTGQSEVFEEVLELVNGKRTFLTTKSPWRGKDGDIIGVIGIALDVTEWKETQNALHESRERLRAIIENTPGCVKLVAPDGTLLEMNAAGVRMCEADSAECVLGRSVFDLISDEHRSAFVAFHERVCNGIPGSMQFEIVGMQGTRRWMETHAVPIPLGPDGSIVHLAITHDITAARVAEETIAAQHSQLIHVSRLSSMGQMVAVISHEITQPLAAIANYSSACELLAKQPTPDMQKLREYLTSITAQSARAGQILGRVRNFVRRSDEHRVEHNIVQLTKDSLNLVKADMRSRQVSVETSFPDRTIFASMDPVQIQQVIVNLITNACDAIESQPTGQRRVLINLQDSENSVTVEIVDSGPGLPIDSQNQLFEPFYTSKTNGMGMGLTICSDIIKSHFGTITADNVPNSGARFRFTIPRAKEITSE